MSRTRQYTRKELESLRRADLQSLFKIHGLKGANQKSDALIDQLVSHFAAVIITRVESPINAGGPKVKGRRLKSIDMQSSGSGRVGDVAKRPGTSSSASASTSTSRLPTTRPALTRPPSRTVKATPTVIDAGAEAGMPSGEWEERFKKLEERQRRSELESEEKLRLIQDKLIAVEAELKAVKAEMDARLAELPSISADVTLSPPSSTPRVIITDPSPLKRSEPTPSSPGSSNVGDHDESSRKRARVDGGDNEARGWSNTTLDIEPHTPEFGYSAQMAMAGLSNPHTPSPSQQGTSDDMSRTPGVEGSGCVTGLAFPIFATTPKPREPHSPTLDAPPSASRQRAWSSSSLPKMLTPGRKRVEPAPRAVSQAHMDLTTITESDEAPVVRRLATPPVVAPLYPASLSRDGTITPPRLSPSPSITESRFQHPTLPTRGSSLAPGGTAGAASRARKASTPAREYMEVALHGLGGPSDSPRPTITPSHRTILGTERYRDTRFGDIPVVAWGSPGVDFGPATPQVNLGRD